MSSPETSRELTMEEKKEAMKEKIEKIRSIIDQLEAQVAVPAIDIKQESLDKLEKELKEIVG